MADNRQATDNKGKETKAVHSMPHTERHNVERYVPCGRFVAFKVEKLYIQAGMRRGKHYFYSIWLNELAQKESVSFVELSLCALEQLTFEVKKGKVVDTHDDY
jgi:hypothetical protein